MQKELKCISYVTKNNIPGLIEQSFQGMELTNESNMYIASGARKKSKKLVKINNKANLIGDLNITGGIMSPGNSELEGLQIIGNYLYYGLVGLESLKQKEQYVFKINKNVIN